METKDSIARQIADELCTAFGQSPAPGRGALPLTKMQRGVLDRIIEYIALNSISPTIQELADSMGVRKVTMYEHVIALEEKGWIRRRRHYARSIEVIADGRARQGMARLLDLARQYAAAV
jgi:SOS-response transcriptional repressor LexA